MRSYSRDRWLEAQAAWRDGRFSSEWEPFRKLAAETGFCFPPEGTRFDGWDDDEPSQRALLVRAIRETPTVLERAIRASHGWGQVVAKVIANRDGLRESAELRERDWAWMTRHETRRTAWSRAGDTAAVLVDSLEGNR